MRKSIRRLGVAAALVSLIALAPAAAASASVGGPTPPVPTGPGGFPPISLPPADGAAANFMIYNYTNCDLVLMSDNLVNGIYHASPPQVIRTGTKIVFRQATAAASGVSDTLVYGVVCDLTIGAPVVAQDVVELNFNMPYAGPPVYILRDLHLDFTVSVDNVSITGNSLAMNINIH